MKQRRRTMVSVTMLGVLGVFGAGCASPQAAEDETAGAAAAAPFSLVAADWGGYYAFQDRIAGAGRPEPETAYATVELEQ